MTLNTEQIRTLIERWKMKVEVVGGEEKLQVTPPSQQELNKWINHIKNNKPLIINEIKKIKAEQEQRKANIEAIEGLKELKAAIAAQEQYEYERQKRWESESLSSILPKPPQVDVEELKTKYPKAWAYIRAEGWANARHYAKAAAGRVALERIINGDDHDQVIADMEAEWNAYTEQHIWD